MGQALKLAASHTLFGRPLRGSVAVLYVGVALSVLLMAVAAAASVIHLRRMAEMRIAVTTQNMALSLSHNTESVIDTIDLALQVSADEIGRQLAAGHADKRSITEFLTRQQTRITDLDLLRATDETGDAIYGAGVPTPPLSVANRDYFFTLRDDAKAGLVISKPIIGKISQKWIWLFARRINKPDGAFGGVVYASIFIDTLDQDFAKLAMDSGGVVTIRDAELGVITRYTFGTRNPIPYGDKKISKPFEDALRVNPQEGTYISGGTSIDGINRTQSYSRSTKYDLLVNVGIAGDAALSEWRSQAVIVTGLATLFALVSAVFARIIGRDWQRQEYDMVRIQQGEERLRLALEAANQGWFDVDLNAGTVTVSAEYARMIGYDQEEFDTSVDNWLAQIHTDDREATTAAFRACIADGITRAMEYRRQTKSGDWKWLRSVGKVVQWDAGRRPTRMSGIHTDITDRKQMEEQVRQLAFYDALTNLPNRRLLNDRLSQTMAASKRSGCYAALLFIDLDNFKPLNDKCGHGVGDLLLIEAASRLKACVREIDTVSRYGGDEFVVMISELATDRAESIAQVSLIAEKIRNYLAGTYRLASKPEGGIETVVEHQCTASIGVALFIDHEPGQDEILNWADAAMYQAKEAGRNQIRFFERQG